MQFWGFIIGDSGLKFEDPGFLFKILRSRFGIENVDFGILQHNFVFKSKVSGLVIGLLTYGIRDRKFEFWDS